MPRSSPPPPSTVSLPARPSRLFAAVLPMIWLSATLPKPSMAARAGEGQVLEVVAERVGDAALDRVGALVQRSR